LIFNFTPNHPEGKYIYIYSRLRRLRRLIA